MKKIKLILNESIVTNINNGQVDLIEDVAVQQKPDYQIIDITVIPDEEYNPTIQSILIDLDESNRLCESAEESKKLSINILSETVNVKTGYSNSLFEFENANHTITLSLVLQETDRNGIYKVEAYTTKGEKVFESNTYKPKKLIESYLNSLANEYLIDKKLNESEEQEVIKTLKDDEGGMTVKVIKAPNGRYFNYYYSSDEEHADSEAGPFSTAEEAITMAKKHRPNAKESINWREEEKKLLGDVTSVSDEALKEFYKIFVEQGKDKFAGRVKREMDRRGLKEAEDPMVDTVKEDLAIEPGSDEEETLNNLYDEVEEDKYYGAEDEPIGEKPTEPTSYSTEDFIRASQLTDEIKNLNIDYSEWNNMDSEERIDLVTPELNRFYNKYKTEFKKRPDVFSLIQYNLTDDNFHTEAKVLRDLKGGE